MNRDTRTFHSNTLLRPIISVCAFLMLIIVAAGVAAAAMSPVPYFSQCDSRWGSDKLGGDGSTICSQGCALTSAAMVMAYYGVDTDPKRLNNAIGRAGYDANYYIYWSAVRNTCHDEVNKIEYFPGTVKPFDTTVLNTHLDSGHPVIVNVGGHFVVVTGRSDGTYYINDPISSAKSTLDAYPNRVGMHIYFGNPPDINKPLVGDWNGNGTDTTGIYNYTTANFSLDSGLNISFGISGDIPITGDWNGNGYDTIGVFRPSTAQFFLDFDNDGVSDMNATLGFIGDIPVVGDWNGDGDDNIGVFRQNHSDTGLTMFFLDLDNSGGSADQSVAFGEPDDLPVIGDWDGDEDGNIGLYRPGSTTGVFYLDIYNDGGSADIVTSEYGDLGDVPIAGDWDGGGDDNIGVYRPETGEFFLNASMPSVPKTIYVDDDFSDDPSEHKWDTIQEGVDDADDGDTVIVYAGEYRENVRVGKSITLEGVGADVVTVRSASAYAHVFEVTADWVNISGFTATGTTGSWGAAVIYLIWADHCTISDNNALNSRYGLGMDGSSNNTLTGNTASNNVDCGIVLYDSSNNMLTGNNASNNGHGIQMSSSSNNTLSNNTANSNNYHGIQMSSSSNNTLYHNNLVDNTYYNACDSCTNQWDSGSEGNYYSDYNGTDNNTDGIGDSPHPLPLHGTSIDRYPLMQPWTGDTPQIDLNGDDQITPADAAIALAIAASGSASCDPTTLAAADVSGDGCVTSLDALMILQVTAGTPANVITWHSYEEGMEIAGAQNKPVMIEVYTVWCKWCKEMDRVIYTDPDVIDLADQFVCIKIDSDKRRDLAAIYNPTGGVPTVVFIRSDDTELHRIGGYPRGGAEAFIQEMVIALSNA